MKTRMTNNDRDAIRAAILDHKFAPITRQHQREEAALAVRVRARAYGDYLPNIDAAPDGAFPSTESIHVNVGGQKHSLSFEGRARVFNKHIWGWENYILALAAGDRLGEEIKSLAGAKEDAKVERRQLNENIRATLSEFRTFDDLVVAWPEAEAFIKARWQSRPDYSANVPAIQLKALTEKLDLPPEERAAA